MKPNSTNNMSALMYVLLFILFCLPYVGTPALILFAIFGPGESKNFARALLLFTVIIYVIAIVAVVLALGGGLNIEQILPELLPENGGIELFRAIPNIFA